MAHTQRNNQNLNDNLKVKKPYRRSSRKDWLSEEAYY